MAFTLAHPAAVLLLRGTRLPVAAMVAGSMAPDAPTYLRLRGLYDATHSLPGAFTIDLALSVLAVALWFAWLRDPLVDLMPAAVRDRLDATARYSRRQWALVVPAALLGTLTHLAWDSFTHVGLWGVRQVGWLHQLHGGHFGFDWAQYGSSAAGLVVVAGWGLVAVRRLPAQPRPPSVPALGHALGIVAAVTVLAGIAATIGAAAGVSGEETGPAGMLAQAAVVGTIIGVLGLLVATAAWQRLSRRH